MDINILYSKDDKEAYAALQKMEEEAFNDSSYYDYLDEYFNMLKNEKSYIRVRGMRMICAVSKWDNVGMIDKRIHELLELVYDDKPTVVRQCIAGLKVLVLYKPNLIGTVATALSSIDYGKYKDSMTPLIKKDCKELLS